MEVERNNVRNQVTSSRRKRAEEAFFSVGLERYQPEVGNVLWLGLPRGNVTRARLRATETFFKQPEGAARKERIQTYRAHTPLYRVALSIATVTNEVSKACADRAFRLSEQNTPISVEFCGKPYSKPLPVDILNCPKEATEPPVLLRMLEEAGFMPKAVELWPQIALARILFYEERQASYFLSRWETFRSLEAFRILLSQGATVRPPIAFSEVTRFHLTPAAPFEEVWTTFQSRPELMIFDYFRPTNEKDGQRFCFFTINGHWKADGQLFGPSRVLSIAGKHDSTIGHELTAHQSQIRALQEQVGALSKRLETSDAKLSSEELAEIIDARIAKLVPDIAANAAKVAAMAQMRQVVDEVITPTMDERHRELITKMDRVLDAFNAATRTVGGVSNTPPRKKNKNHENARQLTLPHFADSANRIS